MVFPPATNLGMAALAALAALNERNESKTIVQLQNYWFLYVLFAHSTYDDPPLCMNSNKGNSRPSIGLFIYYY